MMIWEEVIKRKWSYSERQEIMEELRGALHRNAQHIKKKYITMIRKEISRLKTIEDEKVKKQKTAIITYIHYAGVDGNE